MSEVISIPIAEVVKEKKEEKTDTPTPTPTGRELTTPEQICVFLIHLLIDFIIIVFCVSVNNSKAKPDNPAEATFLYIYKGGFLLLYRVFLFLIFSKYVYFFLYFFHWTPIQNVRGSLYMYGVWIIILAVWLVGGLMCFLFLYFISDISAQFWGVFSETYASHSYSLVGTVWGGK